MDLKKLEKYFNLTTSALEQVKENIISGKEDHAKEIIDMVTNYWSDAKHFEEKEDEILKKLKGMVATIEQVKKNVDYEKEKKI